METYSTEEEQVEALRRWWQENGASTIAAIVIALSAAYGWKVWQDWGETKVNNASDLYQSMTTQLIVAEPTAEQREEATTVAKRLINEHPQSTYAQFAALQLARLAVEENDLESAETQLRWALQHADAGGDTAIVAQLRLARVLAAAGDTEQALSLLQSAAAPAYSASYAIARGDILLSLGRSDEALEAYTTAQAQALISGARVNLSTLEQKIQSLNPVPLSTAAVIEE